MTLKVVLIDTDEQVCFDTGIEIEYDFEMLFISVAEDTQVCGTSKYHKKIQNRLIVQNTNGKLIIDDADETEELYNNPVE